MTMTRKDYEAVALVFRREIKDCIANTEPQSVLANAYTAYRMARVLEMEGGLDRNGNRRFNKTRFLLACNVPESTHQYLADGTMSKDAFWEIITNATR